MHREIWFFFFFVALSLIFVSKLYLGGWGEYQVWNVGFFIMEVFSSYFSISFTFSYHMDFSLHEKEWSQYIVESADIFLGTSITNSMESSCAIFFYLMEQVAAECLVWFRAYCNSINTRS